MIKKVHVTPEVIVYPILIEDVKEHYNYGDEIKLKSGETVYFDHEFDYDLAYETRNIVVGYKIKKLNWKKNISKKLQKVYEILDEIQEFEEVQKDADLMNEVGEAMGYIDNAIDTLELRE